MKRLFSLIICTICAVSAFPQSPLLFSPAEWDFGTIREEEGRVSHTFTGENRSGKPLVILDVVTTCGCTVPEFSRKPIPPGGHTRITVTYDPANRPGSFSRSLGVYSTDRTKIATLTIRGNVIPRTKSIEERYPIDAGGGVRLTTTLCPLTYIYQGKRVTSFIGVVNASDKPVTLTLRPAASSGLLDLSAPERLAPGEETAINFAYEIPADKPRYGTLRDALEVFVDGKSRGTTLVVHGLGVDAPGTRPQDRAPQCEPSVSILKFGPVKRSASPRKERFTLTNRGGGPLIIRAVETPDAVQTSLRPGQRIPAGGQTEVTVTFDPARRPYGFLSEQILLITDDPSRPMRRIRITAVIEE